ncbi:MAG: inositol monophosphatase family protein [Hamadaea sp.]|uniref:inositol monophosphatase family protein n=1 Tax=Hamadaea sp. TaxID=2024425 RepID=UPI00185769ED|nr:inositol monophosphatase family protein [Hamadaea sp.]NUR70953.1 inositol monophosphatase family protein [Hamadaea sp.]NUT21740.1 inositol monophosphatase family protein [Hamadaea sp.]
MSLTDHGVAVAAAQAGAAVVRAKFGSSLTRHAKAPGDFATEADLAAEQAILEVLRQSRPDDAVLGEETGGEIGERTWFVDPLCGTLNFAAETTMASVNVALRTGSGITAAASADPFTGEIFWTDGDRALIRRDSEDRPAHPSAESRLVDLNLDPHPDSPEFSATALLASVAFNQRFRPRVLSTTLAVAWVGAGRRSAYLTAGDLRDSVHFAAGIAFCQAAGCVVTGIQGQPLHTGVGGLLVAADEPTHSALLELLNEVRP